MFFRRVQQKKNIKNEHIADSIAVTYRYFGDCRSLVLSDTDTGKKYEDKIIHGLVVSTPAATYCHMKLASLLW